MKKIFGGLLKKKFSFNKAELEREKRKQQAAWDNVFAPLFEMFPPARRRTASWRRSHASGELKKRQLREAGVLKDPKSMAETRYTPMDKLKEHSKYKRMIEDLKQKIETVFRGLSNGTMNASKAAAKAESLQKNLSKLTLKLVETQEKLALALKTRYRDLHDIGVETGQIALLHFSRKFPEIYRMGGEIGTRIRADLWGLASGAVVEKYQVESVKGKNYYKSLSDKAADGRSVPKHVAAQIKKDIHRTLADEAYFEKEENAKALQTVLTAFSLHHPKIGYCQSMNFMAAGVLMVVRDEERAFWILTRLVLDVMPQDYYTVSMAGVVTDVQVLRQLLRQNLPDVEALLSAFEVKLDIMCCHMFMSLWFGVAPVPIAQRVMDLVICEGSAALVCVVLALVCISQSQLLAQDDAGDLMLLLASLGRNVEETSMDELFSAHFFYTTANVLPAVRKLRASLFDEVRSKQEALMEKCFMRGAQVAERRKSTSAGPAPVAPKSPAPISAPAAAAAAAAADDRRQDNSAATSAQPAAASPASTGGAPTELDWLQHVDRVPLQNVQVLVSMGFSLPAVQRACVATLGKSVQDTLNWLLRHATAAQSSAVDDSLRQQDAKGTGGSGSLLSPPSKSGGPGPDKTRSKRRTRLRVVVPPGVRPGQLIQVKTPFGRTLRVRVPKGHGEGSEFLIECSTRRSKDKKAKKKSRKARSRSRDAPADGKGAGTRDAAKTEAKSKRKFLKFVVPANVAPGSVISVSTPEGGVIKLNLPPGARAGKQIRVEYTLEKVKPAAPAADSKTPRGAQKQDWVLKRFMCSKKPFGISMAEGSIVINGVTGAALVKGVRKGDRVQTIAGKKVDGTTWLQVYQTAAIPFYIEVLSPRESPSTASPQMPGGSPSSPGAGASSPAGSRRWLKRTVRVAKSPFGMLCAPKSCRVSRVSGEAMRAGVRVGDVLESVAGNAVTESTWREYFRAAAAQKKPFNIILRAPPPPPSPAPRGSLLDRIPIGWERKPRLFDATRPIGLELREGDGLLVVGVEAKTQACGQVSVGWRLLRIGGRNVVTRAEAATAMATHLNTSPPNTPIPLEFIAKAPDAAPQKEKPRISLPAALNPFGSAGDTTAQSEPGTPAAPEAPDRSEDQIDQMVAMGLSDREVNRTALKKADGRLEVAVQLVLESQNQRSRSKSAVKNTNPTPAETDANFDQERDPSPEPANVESDQGAPETKIGQAEDEKTDSATVGPGSEPEPAVSPSSESKPELKTDTPEHSAKSVQEPSTQPSEEAESAAGSTALSAAEFAAESAAESSAMLSAEPSEELVAEPSAEPSEQPSEELTAEPSAGPSEEMSTDPAPVSASTRVGMPEPVARSESIAAQSLKQEQSKSEQPDPEQSTQKPELTKPELQQSTPAPTVDALESAPSDAKTATKLEPREEVSQPPAQGFQIRLDSSGTVARGNNEDSKAAKGVPLSANEGLSIPADDSRPPPPGSAPPTPPASAPPSPPQSPKEAPSSLGEQMINLAGDADANTAVSAENEPANDNDSFGDNEETFDVMVEEHSE